MAPIIESLAGIRDYRQQRSPKVFLDTNILITGCGKPHERKLIIDLCAELDVCISDTVYWEFLRNTNIDSFRERRSMLSNWPGGDLAREDRIQREDRDVGEMHARLFLLLLWFHQKDPRRVLKYLTPDLWIAAALVHYRADHVLTTNPDDFPEALFSPIACVTSGEFKVHLLAFDRPKVREAWAHLQASPEFSVNGASFFPKTKKPKAA